MNVVEINPETAMILGRSAVYCLTQALTSATADCGTGSYQQLCDHYGTEGADKLVLRTRCIFISHLHLDHYFGLFNLLLRRRQLQVERGLLHA